MSQSTARSSRPSSMCKPGEEHPVRCIPPRNPGLWPVDLVGVVVFIVRGFHRLLRDPDAVEAPAHELHAQAGRDAEADRDARVSGCGELVERFLADFELHWRDRPSRWLQTPKRSPAPQALRGAPLCHRCRCAIFVFATVPSPHAGLSTMDRVGQVATHLGASSADLVPPLVRAFLRHEEELERADPKLDGFIKELRKRGAGECWHKRGTFLEHLFQTYRSLVIWEGKPTSICHAGLMHSAYSNSYVNLAIFPPDVSRPLVRELVGGEVEDLMQLFCTISREKIIMTNLVQRVPEDVLRRSEPQDLVPREGVEAQHIRSGAALKLSRADLARFVLLTMADFADQFYSWQDTMAGRQLGMSSPKGAEDPNALWPGDCRPGLYMNLVCRMAHVLRHLVACEVRDTGLAPCKLPPVFNYCTEWLSEEAQLRSRDLYWDAVTINGTGKRSDEAAALLREAAALNPHVGEFRILLGQLHAGKGEWKQAEEEAARGVKLMCDWTTAWDKRMTWEGWIAWGRVIVQEARNKRWPNSFWGVISLGLVQ
ncbi:hypothetical protein DFJ74DRAFT_514778 [Hyaloraphidium curvatum]|nr:hypothetical protein DFJ74DRAFT_514778 [Hyaloraphidium curvatum]